MIKQYLTESAIIMALLTPDDSGITPAQAEILARALVGPFNRAIHNGVQDGIKESEKVINDMKAGRSNLTLIKDNNDSE